MPFTGSFTIPFEFEGKKQVANIEAFTKEGEKWPYHFFVQLNYHPFAIIELDDTGRWYDPGMKGYIPDKWSPMIDYIGELIVAWYG